MPESAARRLRRSRCDVAFYMPGLSPLLTDPRAGAHPSGGAETQILLLAKALAARGVSVALIIKPLAGIASPHPNIRLVVIPRQLLHADWRLVGRAVELAGVLQAVIRARPRVVVQRMASSATAWCALAAKVTGARFVWSSANVLDFKWRDGFRNPRDAYLLEVGVRFADAIVVQTNDQVEMCTSVFGREPTLIPSIAETAPDSGSDGVGAALWIGRLVPRKRPLELIDIARLSPESNFQMIGVKTSETTGELESQVTAAAEATPNVELLEPRPRKLVLQAISDAVAVVSSSTDEGMPNIFLEAWARGVPAVCVNYDPDGVVAANGLGISAGGDHALAAGFISKLNSDPQLRSRIGATCRDYVASVHSEDAVARQWLSVLGLEEGSAHQ